MIDFNTPYEYSIDVAMQCYRDISSQEEMTNQIKKYIEIFFENKGGKYTYIKDIGDFNINRYHSEEQDIDELTDKSNNIVGFSLDMNQLYSEDLFMDAYNNKSLFGAPIFAMMLVTDINRAFITIMSKKDYLGIINF